MKICILYGGTSSERDISISTGKSIYDAISDEYEITMCDFDENYDVLLENIQNVDLVFNALHGRFGEDGFIQGLLEINDKQICEAYDELKKNIKNYVRTIPENIKGQAYSEPIIALNWEE